MLEIRPVTASDVEVIARLHAESWRDSYRGILRDDSGGYNIIEIDEPSYSYALICGNSRSYLWILARQPNPSETVMASLAQRAKSLGFDTDALIYVQQKNMGNK